MWRYRPSPSNVSTPSEAARLLDRPTDALRVPEGRIIGAAGALRLRLQIAGEQKCCEYALSLRTLQYTLFGLQQVARRSGFGVASGIPSNGLASVLFVALTPHAFPVRLPKSSPKVSQLSLCASCGILATNASTRIFHLSILRSKIWTPSNGVQRPRTIFQIALLAPITSPSVWTQTGLSSKRRSKPFMSLELENSGAGRPGGVKVMDKESPEAFDPSSLRPALQRCVNNGQPEKDKMLSHAVVKHTNKVPWTIVVTSLRTIEAIHTVRESESTVRRLQICGVQVRVVSGSAQRAKGLPRDGQISSFPQSFLDVPLKLMRVREKIVHAGPIYCVLTKLFDDRLTLHKPKSCHR
ncbi:hypothetical protein LTR91_020118 [Friedmanniomyces endolithicus]|uniref:Uncharacterized protein n=1 Tax=Friedmanniomyces endolithicus TaxID=329885 RepID=A0AAN6HAM6_9PEZI|nr:hypothetical protein LTR94_007650 [Friedmanniomyces endolithicus]KAK0773159.1 hypothetical protein LTR59_015383 [Friedmanniomyces endolithicus]KAK0809879.1 hypothetical protein LTR75_005736 [Friedmanniomyces endolithicus]KAK0868384.1 hypothetical protein LTR87_014206 [Friedmanniomyces endolithicus]KAK0874112.1 hypothetical protein LTS02_000494 [Friedmanniomyces endolithicus]